jgi:aryl-alcohol dehydrogenase-like predicted oxidoreductase
MQNNPPPANSFQKAIQPYLFSINGRSIPYGLGCAYVGHGRDFRDQLQNGLLTLEAAYQLGFRYFDTAPHYGNSEYVVGEFVARVPRESIFLATKFNLKPGMSLPEAREHTHHSLAESLRRLKTDRLDLFQVHDVDRLDLVLPEGGVLEVLRAAKLQGMIGRFGLATRWLPLLKTAVRHGEFDTILTYSDYTPFRQTAAGLIDLARERRVGVINASPLAGANEHKLDLADTAILAASLHFPLSNPGINITLTGPGSVQEVLSTVDALKLEPDRERWGQWQNRPGGIW